jgi:hypothetical protein
VNLQSSQQKPPASAPPSGLPGSPYPLPPTFPPGSNPETYEIEKVTQLLKSAAYFPIFNIPNPNTPNQPVLLIPGIPFLMTAVNVNEQLHRYEVTVAEPTLQNGLRARNRIGEAVANVHIRWTPIPEDFEAAPGKYPPTTLLIPFFSQRFCMLEGQLTFNDEAQSGFRAFGTGRTFPVTEAGKNRLRIGAVIEVLEGLGEFKNLTGAFVINGYITPPNELALSLVLRIMDPKGTLKTQLAPLPFGEIPNPDVGAVFMFFLGEVDPSQPVKLNIAPDGTILGSEVRERLRLVNIGFDIASGQAPRSRTIEGPIVGNVSATLHFNPLDPRRVSPIQTTDGVFTFFDRQQKVLGKVLCNMVEGRAMRTALEGAPMPVFRFAGFGPILGGTEFFQGADGMMSMNSAISIFPRTLSNLYIFRFYDPEGKFQQRARDAWC